MLSEMIPEDQLVLSNETVPQLMLKGPFLPESYAMRHTNEYRPYICQLAHCRIISRDLIILCDDMTYQCRDDIRVELGLLHHRHNLEIIVRKGKLDVVGIDHYLLLNPEDSKELSEYLLDNPLSTSERRAFNGMFGENIDGKNSPRRVSREFS